MPTCPHPTCPCAHKPVTPDVLFNHVQSSPWGSLYLCATCKCVCKSEAVLIQHRQKVHGIGFAATPVAAPKLPLPPIQQPIRPSSSNACFCRVCDRSYTSTSALEQHYRDTPVHPKCMRCHVGFVDDAAIRAHAASVHGSISSAPAVNPIVRSIPSAVFPCRVCDKSYSTTSLLELHYRGTPVHPNCTRCDIGFLDDTAMRAHVASVHNPITCWMCSGVQIYQEDLDEHYKTSPMHALCTVCDVGFEDKEALDQHTDASHPGFRCRTCNVPFGSAALLDAHFQESPRHPRCPECKLSFEDNSGLIQHVIAIFNPLIKDSGRLILKTSQMSSHGSFSNASVVSRASRSSSVARSFSPPSIGARTPTRSVASPVSSLRRQLSTPPRIQSPNGSDPDRGIYEGFSSRRPYETISSSINSRSQISGSPSFSDQVIILDAFEEERGSKHNPESTLTDATAASRDSPPLSAAGSMTTRSIVAGSETASPVSSARSIFGRAPSTTSAARSQAAASPPTFDVMPTTTAFENVPPIEESWDQTALRQASPSRSDSTDTRTRGSAGPVSPSSIKTVSPPPSHVVFPSPGQRERFRIAPANGFSRADSPGSRESERFHSSKPESHRQRSPTEDMANGEPIRSEKPLTPPTPTVVASYPSAQPQTELAPGEKLVSYVYCRICRRDPCRQPAATMCGHVFCYQCISSEVMKTSRCPVCEVPTLLYSIFRLHLV